MPKYGLKHYDQVGAGFAAVDNHVIQLDDEGAFLQAAHAHRVLESVSQCVAAGNTIVSVFVHGWHHNAAPGDASAVRFLKQLSEARAVLREEGHVRARQQLTGSGDARVIGIYVGWRGKSLPMPLDYLTFWGRKAAAERVGSGELAKFMLGLQAIHAQSERRRRIAGGGPFMGLVSVGQDLGGQVLFHATRAVFEKQLKAAVAKPSQARSQARAELAGFGDLVVLLDPALEALHYELIHRLDGAISYGEDQPPRLLVLSCSDNIPRRLFFPLARGLGMLFSNTDAGGQGDILRTALGEYKPHRTHVLVRADRAGRVKLVPTGKHRPFSPFLVSYADASVTRGNAGVFGEALQHFLSGHLDMIEGKHGLISAAPITGEQAVA